MNTPENPSPATPASVARGESAAETALRDAASSGAPLHIVLHAAPRPRRRILVWIGWLGFCICLGMLIWDWSARSDYYQRSQGINERYFAGDRNGTDKVAIIALRGVIMEGSGFTKRQIDRVREDPRVKAVVLRVESPGGTVTGSDYIYHHLQRLRDERQLPLVVSMGSIAASGGYYASMAVGDQRDSIFAEPTSTTGSIGVIVPHYDVSGLLTKWDVQDDSVASHPRKQLLSMTRPMSADDRQIIQQYVDDSFLRFKSIVKAGRPRLREANTGDGLVDPATGRDLATGEIFPAPRALEYGLIDRIGFLEDAIARAAELAGLEVDHVRVVEYQRPASLSSLLGMAEARQPSPHIRETGLSPGGTSGSAAIDALLELSAPRAYYLFTALPPLVATSPE